ncbi:TPA: hypothetical protein DCF80_02695 [Candidatus Saccharibacteria bacterium]|nr:hypothetical protein [Candidatus Saccharibacteria bacterium]
MEFVDTARYAVAGVFIIGLYAVLVLSPFLFFWMVHNRVTHTGPLKNEGGINLFVVGLISIGGVALIGKFLGLY